MFLSSYCIENFNVRFFSIGGKRGVRVCFYKYKYGEINRNKNISSWLLLRGGEKYFLKYIFLIVVEIFFKELLRYKDRG